MSNTSITVYHLTKPQAKALHATAKGLGFTARILPVMQYGCAQPGLSNLSVDYSTCGASLPVKLASIKLFKEAVRQARLNTFDHL